MYRSGKAWASDGSDTMIALGESSVSYPNRPSLKTAIVRSDGSIKRATTKTSEFSGSTVQPLHPEGIPDAAIAFGATMLVTSDVPAAAAAPANPTRRSISRRETPRPLASQRDAAVSTVTITQESLSRIPFAVAPRTPCHYY